MMDIQTMQDQINGLDAALKTLRAEKDSFVKAQGLDESAEKARKDIVERETDLQVIKTELAELRGQKTAALAKTGDALSAKLAEALPEGRGILDISDQGVFIGWEIPGRGSVPYEGLSGGQKIAFDQALTYALMGPGPKTLIIEGAELDQEHLLVSMERLAGLPEDTQVIISTWSRPFAKPEKWLGWKEVHIS